MCVTAATCAACLVGVRRASVDIELSSFKLGSTIISRCFFGNSSRSRRSNSTRRGRGVGGMGLKEFSQRCKISSCHVETVFFLPRIRTSTHFFHTAAGVCSYHTKYYTIFLIWHCCLVNYFPTGFSIALPSASLVPFALR